ncbi:photo-regulated tyrosinase [Mycena pura]|uniref:tyrosinase n=1 Tax=Mycena pura TaxID=153505 RepID=A0AAD6UQP4_9AGAR|nr:photo-regulated tyrosinase [Mycena pura]
MSHFIITGAKGGSTAAADAPNRLEINDLVKIEDQFSLYIQALAAMSQDNQSDLTSFFQIGGIHGLPYIQWGGSGGKEPVDGSWGGYCTHGSMLFPTWHRPYVALFEQVLQLHAAEIAKTYKVDQDRWVKAAANLRAPYWDWASNTVPPPEVIADTTVTITRPDGTRGSVPNPLFGYQFHPIDKSFPEPYSQWHSTLRHPTTGGRNAKTDVEALTEQLSSAQEDVTSSTYNMLTRVHTWPAFSNHSPDDGGSGSNSIEAIHDGIHTDVGGNGQMSDPSVAGFDPIFFLHHANVDRMISLWSALNPGVWIGRGPAEGGTFTIPPDATIGPQTDLTPFWHSQSSYWISTQTTKTSTLGYTYPEFNGLDMGNTAAVRTAIARAVNNLYGGGSFQGLPSAPAGVAVAAAQDAGSAGADPSQGAVSSSSSDEKPAQPHVAPRSLLAHKANTGNPGTELPQHPVSASVSANDGGYFDWATRIHVEKQAVGGSFSVLIFLGPVPDDPREWRRSPSFVGGHHAFVNTATGQCANCRRQAAAHSVIEGFVHLNKAIARGLPAAHGSFDPAVVEPYLRQALSWRVQRADKSAVELSDMPSLEVVVCATRVHLEPGADLPSHGPPQYHPSITAGRPGGASPTTAHA